MSHEDIPGFVSESTPHGEKTVVVEVGRLVEASEYLRDELGFNFLSDITPTDYLNWGKKGVAGYWGNAWGRDINAPGSWGLHVMPEQKPKRFAVSYHLLAMRADPERIRVQVWVDDAEEVPSVVSVWPTADFHEREVWDMMGIPVTGHPNMKRILLDDDWEGHPLRKDYPLGGEPVRFSEAE